MLLIATFLLMVLFLVGTFFLTAMISALRRIQKKDSSKQLKNLGNLFFYHPLHSFFFPKAEYETLFFATLCAQNVTRFCYAASATLFLMQTHLVQQPTDSFSHFWLILSFLGFLLASLIFGDYLPRNLGNRLPEITLRVSAPFSSLFLLFAFPLSYLFLKAAEPFSRTVAFDQSHEPSSQAKQELIEMIEEAKVAPSLDDHDKKLIESVFSFRDLIAREVMVPRVDMFSLPQTTTIKEAAKLIKEEGYSRIPVYRNTVDQIVGVLMYKDILYKYMEYEQSGNDPKILEAPVETIQKSVLYTPETKKISSLLQEFRNKQVHLAIVVDEYGGTEGIVTIEDILEALVGDIADEYDQEEALYTVLPSGGWIVDARMSILDAEEQLGLKFPEEGEFDTIGGYVFHCTGTIPSKGFIIHHDDFEIEILRANERTVEKVKIKPIIQKTESDA